MEFHIRNCNIPSTRNAKKPLTLVLRNCSADLVRRLAGMLRENRSDGGNPCLRRVGGWGRRRHCLRLPRNYGGKILEARR